MLVLDGGFTSMFCIPPNVNKEKLIKITPLPYPGADICPVRDECFSLYDIFYSRTKEQMFHQMEVGYRVCERAHQRLISKGLVEKDEEDEHDRFGRVGSCEHMLAEREDQLMYFKKNDRRNTKWRVKSWLDLSQAQ
jgi:hypothetical protein